VIADPATRAQQKRERRETAVSNATGIRILAAISAAVPVRLAPLLVSVAMRLPLEPAVSYIDRVTEESIPTLPTGTCIFSGIASQMPLKINVKPLSGEARPQSETRKFSVIVPAAPQGVENE
jgi:hypothetical protein